MSKKYTRTQIQSLNSDEGFQAIIGADKELDKLFTSPKRSRDDRITELALALGGVASIGENGKIPAPTPGVLLLLGIIESPLLNSSSKPRLIDVDIALWIFVNGKDGLNEISNMRDIENIADGACAAVNIDSVEAWKLMKEMVWESFAGLERIPKTGLPGEKCRFDLGWYAGITSRIAEAANITANEAGWQMPLALGTHYIVALHEKNGGKTYEPNASEKVMARLNELMDKRIEEKKYK